MFQKKTTSFGPATPIQQESGAKSRISYITDSVPYFRLSRQPKHQLAAPIFQSYRKRRLKQHQSKLFIFSTYSPLVLIWALSFLTLFLERWIQCCYDNTTYNKIDYLHTRADPNLGTILSWASHQQIFSATMGTSIQRCKISSRQGRTGFAWCIAITRHPWTIISWSACIHNQSSSCPLPSRPFFCRQKQFVWCPRACKYGQSQNDIKSEL